MSAYPPPPWHMHGDMLCVPYAVDRAVLRLPFPTIDRLGRTAGLLAYVRYAEPSPLTYDELIWMPSVVRAGKRVGQYVEAMFVNDTITLRAGRELWALPKTLADFERVGDRIEIDGDASMTLRYRKPRWRGPRIRGSMSTLQDDGARRIRFSARWQAHVTPCMAKVERYAGAFSGFPGAGGWRPAFWMSDFASVMAAPKSLDSLDP